MNNEKKPPSATNESPVIAYQTPDEMPTAYQAHIVKIVIRIMAIYLFIEIFTLAFSMLFPLFRFRTTGFFSWGEIISTTLAFIGSVVIPALLWVLSGKIAFWIVGQVMPPKPDYAPFSPSAIQPIAFSIIGVWIFVTNLASFFVSLYRLIQESRVSYGSSSIVDVLFTHYTFLTLLGAGLFFGAQGLANLFHRFQHAELHHKTYEPENTPQSPSSTPSDPNSPSR